MNRAMNKNYYTMDYQYDWCTEEKTTTIFTEKSVHDKPTKGEGVTPFKIKEDEVVQGYVEAPNESRINSNLLFSKQLKLPQFASVKLTAKRPPEEEPQLFEPSFGGRNFL
eukprot:TRINITY_DN8388_c0_g2_i3.p1 TRINITY_DN8388_c0_g2~~TRINITY_DN8388_c0_g2_i3.p1  ORF type:complete len:110 (+),score=16.80 TRINITY_DN8388_c0_g2_i3:136-465(+)